MIICGLNELNDIISAMQVLTPIVTYSSVHTSGDLGVSGSWYHAILDSDASQPSNCRFQVNPSMRSRALPTPMGLRLQPNITGKK